MNHSETDNKKLQLFIGWSGPVSHEVGKALFKWLPKVLPFIQPWISSQNVSGGREWNPQLESILKSCDAGIICITNDNVRSEWLHFEAGSLALRIDKPLIIPYLFNIASAKLGGPLAQFQWRDATLAGTTGVIEDIIKYANNNYNVTKFSNKIINNKYLKLEKIYQDIENTYGSVIETSFQLNADVGLDFRKIIDNNTDEVIITAQNMQGMIRNNILSFLNSFYEINPSFKTTIILARPEFFKTLSQSSKERKDYHKQFCNTLKNLRTFKSSLPPESQSNFIVYFHPGVSSLSAVFRDPSSKTKGLVAISPKWATDIEPENRIFYLIDRINNDYLFKRLYGHIGIMNDPVHSKTLEEMETFMFK